MQVRSTDTQNKGRGKHLIIARRLEVGLFMALAIQGDAGAAAFQREHVTTLESQPNQTIEAFLHTAGKVLRDYTDRTGHEACAAIGFNQTDNTYSVEVFSDGVSIGCTIRPAEITAGSAFSGQTIHSHPHEKILVLGPAERAWAQQYNKEQSGLTSVRNDGSSGFSKVDRQYNGVSWLVAGGNLLRLDGRGKTQNMGEIER